MVPSEASSAAWCLWPKELESPKLMTRCSLIFSLPFLFYFFAKASEKFGSNLSISSLLFSLSQLFLCFPGTAAVPDRLLTRWPYRSVTGPRAVSEAELGQEWELV